MTAWELVAVKGNLALGFQMLWYNDYSEGWARSMMTLENGTWIPIDPERVEAWKEKFGYELS